MGVELNAVYTEDTMDTEVPSPEKHRKMFPFLSCFSRVFFLFCFVLFFNCSIVDFLRASQVVLVVKNLPANAGDIRDTGSISGSGRSPAGEQG